MSTTTRRVLIGAAVILLGVYAVLSVSSTWDAADRLRDDRQDLSEIRQKLKEMEQVADAPRVAALDLESPDQIVNRINAALKQAKLQETVLANQTPSEPQRIGQSDFTLRRIDIRLNAATIPEITAFCDALKDESTGSVVRDLQLFDPNQTGSRETWNSQLTLTQIIFSPKSDA